MPKSVQETSENTSSRAGEGASEEWGLSERGGGGIYWRLENTISLVISIIYINSSAGGAHASERERGVGGLGADWVCGW